MFVRQQAALVALIGFVGIAIAANEATGAPFAPGNILVARERFGGPAATLLHEYTKAGQLVQTVTIGAGDAARDVVIDSQGRAQVFYKTFDPVLWQFSPATAQTSTRTYPGWSSINNLRYGGLSVHGNSVFATDMGTANEGSPSGLLGFDLASGQVQRVNDGSNYIQVTTGYDGLIYALHGGTSPEPRTVDVFNPVTLQWVRTFELPADATDFAVGAAGEMYILGHDGWTYHFTAAGSEVRRLNTSSPGGMRDLDLGLDGTIVLASHGGMVVVTDTALQSFTQFHAGYNHTNNSLGNTSTQAVAIVPVPEPGAFSMAGVLVAGLLMRRRCV